MPFEQLSKEERAAIYELSREGLAQAEIARQLRRHRSTISRELTRNLGCRSHYHHEHAHQIAQERRSEASNRSWTAHQPLVTAVRTGLKQRWSPEQIANRLRRDHPRDESMRISHETIYRWLFDEHRAGRSLAKYLRRRGTRRRSRSVGERQGKRGKIPGRVGIEERPEIVENRKQYGHWEADTVEGGKGTGLLLTLVERKSRYTLVAKINNKRADTVSAATVALLINLPAMLRRTVTADNGKEFAAFAVSDAALEVRTFFANPHSPWERGANENTNGLIRDWLPKGSDFRTATKAVVDRIQRMLNNRPRKCLAYRTPLEAINRLPGVALQI